MKVTPLRDRVLIKPIKENKETESGIILEKKDSNTTTIMAMVMAVGDEAKVDVGDTIIYEHPGKITVTIEGDDCLIVRMGDIIAVIT